MISTSLIVTFVSIFGSFLGFLVQMHMAKSYGTGVNVDAYLYAINSPTFLSGMISALFSYTVVPNLAKLHNENQRQNKFIVSVLALSFGMALLILMVSPILIWMQKNILPINSEILEQKNIQRLFMLGWSVAAVQILVSSVCAILTGLKRPIFSTFLNLGPYIGMLGFMFTAPGSSIENLAWGFLTGTTGSFFLALYSIRARIVCPWYEIAWIEMRQIIMHAPYTIIAVSCFSAYAIIDSYWAPRGGPGVLASLGYSQRLIIALGNLAVAGPSAVFAPKFSELVAQGSRRDFEKMFNKVMASTFFIACSLAILLFANGEQLVGILFVRGAFNAEDSAKVAVVLQYCLPGMVCMLLSVICLRVLFCFKNVEKKAAILGVLWLTSYFALSGTFINYSGKGIAIAYSLTWIICFIYILAMVLVNKRKQLAVL